MEDAWRDQYPSLMCLVHHRHDTDVIVDCAKRLLDEGKDPSWFEGMWDNMGGGIPADTLRALECAFVALYTRNRGLSQVIRPEKQLPFPGLLRGQKGMR